MKKEMNSLLRLIGGPGHGAQVYLAAGHSSYSYRAEPDFESYLGRPWSLPVSGSRAEYFMSRFSRGDGAIHRALIWEVITAEDALAWFAREIFDEPRSAYIAFARDLEAARRNLKKAQDAYAISLAEATVRQLQANGRDEPRGANTKNL